MTAENAAKRLQRLAAHIPDNTWLAGANWYANEAAWIAEHADAAGLPTPHVIDAYAALSPRLRLAENRKALVALLQGRRPTGVFNRSIDQALAALYTRTLPNGPKVRNFACNLKCCDQCVTVDIWASRAA